MYRILFFFLLFPFMVHAQEVITGLHLNQVQYQNSLMEKKGANLKSADDTIYYFIFHTISLPFIDDFSTNKINKESYNTCESGVPYARFKVGTTAYQTYAGRLEPSIRTIRTQTSSNEWNETQDTLPYEIVYFYEYKYPTIPIDTVKYYPTFNQLDSVFINSTLVSNRFYTDSLILVNEIKTLIQCYETGNPLWIDNNVYLNTHYPIQPPTVGVATFDGADKNGIPYDWSVIPNYLPHGKADYLTSMPLDLGTIEKSDSSVYFSFYFQPQGRGGNAPQNIDSLLVQFKENDSLNEKWTTVWFSEGFGLGQDNATSEDYRFKYVSFKVDSHYYYKGFSFRFLNYATLTGAVDQWNVDFVRLDKNRAPGDSSYSDRAFVYPHKSLLKMYQNIPFTHYTYKKSLGEDLLYEKLSPFIHNLQSTQENINITSVVQGDNMPPVTSVGSALSFKPNDYCQVGIDCKDAVANNLYLLYDVNTEFTPGQADDESGLFSLTLKMDTVGNDLNHGNDSIRTEHNFYNYYAYDDGTAENGYGLNVLDGQIAMRYKIYKPDVLRAVAMYFDPQTINFFTDDSPYMFTLQIYTGIDKPETLIYEEDSLRVKFGNGNFYSKINDFAYYFIDANQTLNIDPGGYLFIGFKQQTTQLLGLGFDRNNNSNENMFYNIQDGNGWYQSQLPGSWMIRPCFGEPFEAPKGINELRSNPSLVLIPNPTHESFSAYSSEITSAQDYEVQISDISGRLVKRENATKNISIVDLERGVYTVAVICSEGTFFSTKKLIIVK